MVAARRGGRSLAEMAYTLREMGLKLIDIAAELYPDEHRRWLATRDRRLYEKLVWRVNRLIHHYRKKLLFNNGGDFVQYDGMYNSYPGFDEEHRLADEGEVGAEARTHVPIIRHPRTRKAGKRGADRQIIEYEQYLYNIYKRSGIQELDPDYILWGTIRRVHGLAFRDYYSEYGVNIWDASRHGKLPRRGGEYVKAYAAGVILAAAMMHDSYRLVRARLLEALRVDREAFAEVFPIILSKIV